MWARYKRHSSFVLGFHGCSEEVGEKILAGKDHFRKSNNEYDWLGPGIYFWENNPERAMQFASDAVARAPKTTKGKILKPFVVGAIIDLRLCFNLLDSDALKELRDSYDVLEKTLEKALVPMPKNSVGPDRLMRKLDCAVINTMHGMRAKTSLPSYDTVRGAFGREANFTQVHRSRPRATCRSR